MNVALVAEEAKKVLMQNFCIAYRNILSKHTVFATGTTAQLVEDVTNLKLKKFLAGNLGGAQQLCARIEQNEMDLVIFLRDPENPNQKMEPLFNDIMRLCDLYNIPLATNLASAELAIKALERGDFEWREIYH